jgi:DNA-binding NarL/FixJ family response regulator
VPVIAQRRSTRILLVTDPADKKVPERTQTNFVHLLRQAGGQAEQFIVQATDDDRHGVVAYARTATAGCLRGASTEDIAQRLQQQVEKRLASKAAVGQSAPPALDSATANPASGSMSVPIAR